MIVLPFLRSVMLRLNGIEGRLRLFMSGFWHTLPCSGQSGFRAQHFVMSAQSESELHSLMSGLVGSCSAEYSRLVRSGLRDRSADIAWDLV